MLPTGTGASTVGSEHFALPEQAEREVGSVPALTILGHPDLQRIGDRVLLGELRLGNEALLGRATPDFARPGTEVGHPLGDRQLSRRPLCLRPRPDGGLELDRSDSPITVAADGTELRSRRGFSLDELAGGVVLELAGRVALLLHVVSLPLPQAPPLHGLIGESPAMVRLREEARRVAATDLPVLLQGETGTGKELLARALHDASPRRGGRFVAVNLGALPPALALAELFGAARGAFTGAVHPQEGYFRRAHGGTLLLDEVGEAPPEVQVAMLRALDSGEVSPLGTQASVRVDVRVVAATDADLAARVVAGSFRSPLFHRLAACTLRLPPLRERRDDIGRLLVHFLQATTVAPEAPLRSPAARDEAPRLSSALVARLARHSWPGNVRQLRNVTAQLMLVGRGQTALEPGPEVERLLGETVAPPASAAPPPARRRRRPSQVSEEELLAALRASDWELKRAADRLGISRPSLYERITASSRVRTAGALSPEEIARCHRECGGDLSTMAERLEVSRRALGRRVRELGLGGPLP
jgi:two-component system, NtrC family, nitrogen regulation response regulator GlnG